MKLRFTRNIPKLLAFLPIFAFLPQLVPGGEMVKLLLKAGVIVVFTLLFFVNGDLRVSRSYIAMASMLIVSALLTCVANSGSILTAMINTGISAITVLFFYDRAKRCRQITKDDLLWFYKIYAYFIMVSCIYNLAINYRALLNIYSLNVYGEDDIASFFDNKNTFGVFLLFGVLATTILKIETNQRRWTIFSAIFLLNEVMAMCRTAIVLSAFLLVATYFADRKRLVRKLAVAAIVAVAVIVVWQCLPQVRTLFQDKLFGNTQSLDARNEYIRNLLPNITGIHVLVGYGQGATDLAYTYTGNSYFHNTFLQAYAYGGVIRLALLLAYMGISFGYCLRIRKRSEQDGNLCLISLAMYCIYSFSEAVVLFDSQVVSMVSAAFVISLPILLYNASRNEELLSQNGR